MSSLVIMSSTISSRHTGVTAFVMSCRSIWRACASEAETGGVLSASSTQGCSDRDFFTQIR